VWCSGQGRYDDSVGMTLLEGILSIDGSGMTF